MLLKRLLVGSYHSHFYNLAHLWIGFKLIQVLGGGRTDAVQTSLFGPAKSFILYLKYPVYLKLSVS